MPHVRLTVLGDSFAEGRGDPQPGGGFGGWVPRLAARLGIPPNRYRNLGTHQATTQDVVDYQLPTALEDRSPLIGLTVGVNDLVSRYSPERFRANISRMLAALAGEDTLVFTVTYPDIPANLPVPEAFRTLLRQRFAEANQVLRGQARRTGTFCLDVAADDRWMTPAMWDADGIHPSALGHRVFADMAAEMVEDAISLGTGRFAVVA